VASSPLGGNGAAAVAHLDSAAQRFRFMPVTSGETTLTMAYVRPWEHNGPVRSAVYRVVIVPSADTGVPQR